MPTKEKSSLLQNNKILRLEIHYTKAPLLVSEFVMDFIDELQLAEEIEIGIRQEVDNPRRRRKFKGEVNQKGKNSVVIRGHIRDHFHIIYKFEGNLNPELQADMSISVYFVNVLIPKVITSYKVFGPYISTSFCSLIHFVHCSFFP